MSTGGAALVTGILGIFFTDWSGSRSSNSKAARVDVTPGGMMVSGHF